MLYDYHDDFNEILLFENPSNKLLVSMYTYVLGKNNRLPRQKQVRQRREDKKKMGFAFPIYTVIRAPSFFISIVILTFRSFLQGNL